MAFTFIDLFAGIGGFKMALQHNGGYCLGFSEIDQNAIQVYCENFGVNPDTNLGDIKQIKTLPPHDLLTAGVPCQSWSIAGKNLGFNDDRGQLWNDTLYLLQQSQPKAFIFENVKGLADPRNQEALGYILARIKEAGYYANYFVLNSFDYGVLQNRVRVYIIGFRDYAYFSRFHLPPVTESNLKLGDLLGIPYPSREPETTVKKDLLSNTVKSKTMSLSQTNGLNDYFLFNDIRNGHTTIHSWDIIETTQRQKDICLLLLKNRRKKCYGPLDGNPLSLQHLQALDSSIEQKELDELVALEILKPEKYGFYINAHHPPELSPEESLILALAKNQWMIVDHVKKDKFLKLKKISVINNLTSLETKGVIHCHEIRYDFKNTKISTGLWGINRIFLPTSPIFSTLVASDTNDFIALKSIETTHPTDFKHQFIQEIYQPQKFRKITPSEACLIQGFPASFKLPPARAKWMKLIGNSVSVPVIDQLCQAIVNTGVFNR